jgi:hypothetical protein
MHIVDIAGSVESLCAVTTVSPNEVVVFFFDPDSRKFWRPSVTAKDAVTHLTCAHVRLHAATIHSGNCRRRWSTVAVSQGSAQDMTAAYIVVGKREVRANRTSRSHVSLKLRQSRAMARWRNMSPSSTVRGLGDHFVVPMRL